MITDERAERFGGDWVDVLRSQLTLRTARSAETPLHHAADRHVPHLSVALRYAFAVGRKKLRATRDATIAANAVKVALTEVIEPSLVKALVAGGRVGAGMLRAAAFNPDQPRDEQGQWTEGGGSWRSDPLARVPDVLYRGTEPGSFEQTARDFAGGELGGGIYVTEHFSVAATYGGGPGASVEAGTRVVHEIEWAQKPTEKETGFLEGVGPKVKEFGREHFSQERLISGEGKELWRGQLFQIPIIDEKGKPLSHTEYKRKYDEARADLTKTARASGLKVIVGLSNTPAANQITILDKSAVKVKRVRALAGPKLRMQFDATNPNVVKWARKHAAELIDDISETSKKRIQLAISELHDDGDWDLALDRIMASVGDEDRANLIARHESMLAASEGQRQGWDQAVDEGLLTGDEKRVWIATGDEKVCPICEELDGKRADLDGEYEPGVEGPPAHVMCRCTEGIA